MLTDIWWSGVSSLGVSQVPWHAQILADQLTLSQPGVTDYAHLITSGTPGFSDLPTALDWSKEEDDKKTTSAHKSLYISRAGEHFLWNRN